MVRRRTGRGGPATGTFQPFPRAMSGGGLSGRTLWIQWGAGVRVRRLVGGMEERRLHAAARPPLRWRPQVLFLLAFRASRRLLQSPVSNIKDNLSGSVVDIELLLLDLAADAGDERRCLRDEVRSGACLLDGLFGLDVLRYA